MTRKERSACPPDKQTSGCPPRYPASTQQITLRDVLCLNSKDLAWIRELLRRRDLS